MGHKVNFCNTIIILTSNVGASLANSSGQMGFNFADHDDANYESMKERISDAAKKQFRPEFINRFDDLIVFRRHTTTDLERIVQLETDKLIQRLADKQIRLTLSPEVIRMIVEKGSDVQYGARPIRRAIETLLEDPIAEAMLRGDLLPGQSSEVERRDTQSLAITFKPEATKSKKRRLAAPKKSKVRSNAASVSNSTKKKAPGSAKND